MKRCENFKEALRYLKEGEMLTSNGQDQFFLHASAVEYRNSGSFFRLKWEDFCDLYQNTAFWLYDDEENLIDTEKDEAYYRYYKK